MNTNLSLKNAKPHLPYEKIKIDECHICLEYLVGEIAEISCGHIYHLECIKDWIARKGNHKCCCICEKNTEIVNIVNLPDSKIKCPTTPILYQQNSNHISNYNYQNNQRNINTQNNQRNIKNRCCHIL